jgi:maltoporin
MFLRMIGRTLPLIGILAASSASAIAENPDTSGLREELDALRSDYETRINRLENRIRELEAAPVVESKASPARNHRAKTPPRKAPVPRESAPSPSDGPAAETRAAATHKAAASKFDENTEIRQLAKGQAGQDLLAERIEDVLEGYLDINGYFRAGYGRSSEGGPQRAFGIPGVAKYRLGNETENYGELAFSKTFYPAGIFADGKGIGPDDPVARMVYRLSFVDSYDDYGASSDTDFASPELWGSLANVVPGMPDAKVWAGNRFYRRHDIHINDFYFWDMSGGGGGIEDIPVAGGKLAFAWIGDGARSSIYTNIGQPDPDNLAGFSKSNFDIRYYDWNFLGGKGELGLTYSNTESGVDADGNQADASDGFALSLVKTDQGFLDKDSLHKLSLQIGTGPAKTFSSGFDTFSTADGTFIRPDPDESWRFRATDQIVVKPWDNLSVGSALVYQYTDFGDNAPDQQWISGGVRPIWHITDRFNIALEAGADWVSDVLDGSGDSGVLGKITIAPQVSLGGEFFSRPVLRAFLTYAAWSDGLEGTVGGPDYADENSGWTWGMQMETWW